jgi:hypothetical protein
VHRMAAFYPMQCNHKIYVPIVPVPTEKQMDNEIMLLGETWFDYWIPLTPSVTDMVNTDEYRHHLGDRSEPDGTVNSLSVFCLPQRKKWRRPDNENEALYHDVFNSFSDTPLLVWFGNIIVVKHTMDGQVLDISRDDAETIDILMNM